MRKIPAIQIEQGGVRLFVTALRAAELTDEFCKPDAWTPSNREGYQREPVESRFKKIADYMEGGESAPPLLPQAIVLNTREKGRLTFKENGSASPKGDGVGVLQIPDDALPLFEVDGQHRVGGARRAVEEKPELGDFPFPVVITEGLDRLHEALAFFIINTRQKRVPTDLAQRIITNELNDPELRKRLIEEGHDWIGRATKIVDVLNATEGQPWYGAIGVPGMKMKYALKQNSFVQSLRPILDAPAWAAVDPEDVARVLVHYWKALRDVFPEAFENHRDYVIQKTIGVFPLHGIAPQVFELAVEKDGYPLKPKAIREILTQLADKLSEFHPGHEPAKFWDRKEGEAGKYTGQKGFRTLRVMFQERLPAPSKAKVA
jgi:DGQHR domain-containing protein